MESNKLNLKILENLKNNHIKPKAKWLFLVKNYLIWLFSFVSLLISAFAFSTMIYLLEFNNLKLKNEIRKSSWEILMLTLPYFWIIFLIIFIFLIYYNIKKTKTGYRYPIWLLSVLAVSASIFLGSIFSFMGWGNKLDEALSQKAPLYGKMLNPQIEFWSNPNEGRLLGLVLSDLDENKSFKLIDAEKNIWMLQIKNNYDETDMSLLLIKPGNLVRILGTLDSSNQFSVFKILPQGPGRRYFDRFRDEGQIFESPRSMPGWRHQQN